MKKYVFSILLLLLVLFGVGAQAAQYGAMVKKSLNIYSEKGGEGVVMTRVPRFGEVTVLEYGEDYCRIFYNKEAGYVATEDLFCLRSYDPQQYKVPGHVPAIGYVLLNDEMHISGGDFEGTQALQGTVVCVNQAGDTEYNAAVWRGETSLPAIAGEYTAFVAWEEAQSGDVIGGFTTFYGDQQGGELALERENNILRGCELLNGTIVPADKLFSFNKICAPYSSYNGYQYAPNVGGNGFGYGGGVCQLTTTLYNAVLPLPLRLRDWCIHQYDGVVYVPQFFDAAVGDHDFSFVSKLPYAVKISASAQNGVLTVLISRE
ncbi:MAG: VanW family protein [Clostridia bacterium]|nr:VanW family protein [Clostridia bacterium]